MRDGHSRAACGECCERECEGAGTQLRQRTCCTPIARACQVALPAPVSCRDTWRRDAVRVGFERAGDLEAARAVRAEMQAAGLAARKPSGPLPSYKAPAYPDTYGRRHGKQVVQGTQALGLHAHKP